MTKLEQKKNKISFGWILNLCLSIIWLIYEFIKYAEIGEKLEVGTIMWVCLSIYILIKKGGNTL